MQPTIVIVTFNRPLPLSRLLKSIANAQYDGYKDVDLIISIDHGGGDDILQIANSFIWPHGSKNVLKHSKNLGLRNHIIACGELTRKCGSVIILEDDCFVGINFYDFACQASNYYAPDEKIAGISLYAYQVNENAQLPFAPVTDGYAGYFVQVPSSLGQVWTEPQWTRFKTWYDNKPVIEENDKLPGNVKAWPETSWKKYFYKYMVDEDLYFVYPAVSQLTNFGDTGTHFNQVTSIYQVPLEKRNHSSSYSLVSFKNSFNKYDAYFEMLPECLKQHGVEVTGNTGLDTFGTKQLDLFNYEFLYSIKDCKKPIQSFGMGMYPMLQNIIYGIYGTDLHFAKRTDFIESSEAGRQVLLANYQSMGYTNGVAAGSNQSAIAIMRSTSYKLGYALLHPLSVIKKIFSIPVKKKL